MCRSGIARLLKREGMARLEDVIPHAEGETITAKKTFKDYEPGFLHVDIKYLPQMPDETSRRYLFVAIDRATRWVFLHIYGDMTERSSVDFLRGIKLASPIKISKILTDNGSQFTAKDKKPSGNHAFDKVCTGMNIEHRLAPPRHPQTNGMVERFNGRISELIKQTRFDSRADLDATLLNYLKLYNHHIPQRAIGSTAPIQALKEWHKRKPELFVKRETESALTVYARELDRNAALRAARDQSALAATQAPRRYHFDRTDFLTVLDGDRSFGDFRNLAGSDRCTAGGRSGAAVPGAWRGMGAYPG
jgi:transposase InsO family protein